MQQPGSNTNPPAQLAEHLVVVIIALVVEHVGQTILQHTYTGESTDVAAIGTSRWQSPGGMLSDDVMCA